MSSKVNRVSNLATLLAFLYLVLFFFHRSSISCRSSTLGRVHFMFSTIGKWLSDVTMGI